MERKAVGKWLDENGNNYMENSTAENTLDKDEKIQNALPPFCN